MNVLVATGGSPHSRLAVDYGARLADDDVHENDAAEKLYKKLGFVEIKDRE